MKLSSALFIFSAIAPFAVQTTAAQTTPAHPAKPAGTAAAKPAGTTGCAKLPEMSPKVPSLTASAPCAKHLYTITTIPTVKLENVSPFEPASLIEDLGILSRFSLDYVDVKVGTGELAGSKTWHTMAYTGYLLDGTKFDSSMEFPFALGQHSVIPGWDTGLAGMRVGGKRRLYIPFQLAYGTTAHGPIPARSMLVFDLELLAVSDVQPKPKAPPAPPAPPAGAAPAPPAGAPPAPGSVTPPPPPPATSPAGSTPPKE
jgi:peptidylprolyl isomerase